MFIFHIHVFTLTYFNVFVKFCSRDLKLLIHFKRPAFQRQRGVRRSIRDAGTAPCRRWWIRKETLHSTWSKTGSQWSVLRMKVMWLNFPTLIRILAALHTDSCCGNSAAEHCRACCYSVEMRWTIMSIMREPRGQLHRSMLGRLILSFSSRSSSPRSSTNRSATWNKNKQTKKHGFSLSLRLSVTYSDLGLAS